MVDVTYGNILDFLSLILFINSLFAATSTSSTAAWASAKLIAPHAVTSSGTPRNNQTGAYSGQAQRRRNRKKEGEIGKRGKVAKMLPIFRNFWLK